MSAVRIAGLLWPAEASAAVLVGAFMSSSFQNSENAEAGIVDPIAAPQLRLVTDAAAVGEARERRLAHLVGDLALYEIFIILDELLGFAGLLKRIDQFNDSVIGTKVDLAAVVLRIEFGDQCAVFAVVGIVILALFDPLPERRDLELHALENAGVDGNRDDRHLDAEADHHRRDRGPFGAGQIRLDDSLYDDPKRRLDRTVFLLPVAAKDGWLDAFYLHDAELAVLVGRQHIGRGA